MDSYATQYFKRTQDGFDSSENDAYSLFLTEDMMLSVAGFSYLGRRRPLNEDNYILQDGTLVVADGAGGHNSGEIASHLVCDVFERENDPTSVPIQHKELSDTIREAHTYVIKEAAKRPKELGKEREGEMCSTVAALRFLGNKVSRAYVGDSRIYRLRNNRLKQLSEDDSVAWERYRKGEITRENVRTDKNRHFITSAIGFSDSSLSHLHDSSDDVQLGDVYLLCTDGLWDELPDREIGRLIKQGYVDHPDDDLTVAKMLVTAANSAGGRDNITAVLARAKGIPIEILVERGIGAIEEDDTTLLLDLFSKHRDRLLSAHGSKARYVLAEYTQRTGLSLTARDFYLEAIEQASPQERKESYFKKTVDTLLWLYSSLYIQETGASNGREQIFFRKVLELRGKAEGYKERIDATLCERVEQFGDFENITELDNLRLGSIDAHVPALRESIAHGYLQIAEKALARKDYANAQMLLEKMHLVNTETPFMQTVTKRQGTAYVGLARVYYVTRQFEALHTLFSDEHKEVQELMSYKKDVINDWYELGRKAEREGDYSDARAYYRRIIDFEPSHVRAHFHIGTAYEAQLRHDQAKTAYKRTLTLAPTFTEAREGLTRVKTRN
ncbi:protein phosphatase 2C domain-containing protein [Candidatus Woesearchaeota archaeon]|nr:protein phosphatase 2C domain-containing protein [Candidatus Woesearchaeota archaeon]